MSPWELRTGGAEVPPRAERWPGMQRPWGSPAALGELQDASQLPSEPGTQKEADRGREAVFEDGQGRL